MLQQEQEKIILVMGITGAGKSYLISKMTGQDVEVGHSLKSCTSKVEEVEMKLSDGSIVKLLDTPGFDDTNISDTDILETVSSYLYDMYTQNVKVTGIIYTQRISDIRMQGASMKSLKMFQKLCGDKMLNNVVLLTTRWDSVEEKLGEQREKELEENFWEHMINKGSKVMRYRDEHDIAKVMAHLLGKNAANLLIQEELDAGKILKDTAAGEVINQELKNAEKKHKEELELARAEKEEAIRENDLKAQLAMEKYEKQMLEKMAKIQEDRDTLERNMKNELEEMNKRREDDNRNHEIKLAAIANENAIATKKLEDKERETARQISLLEIKNKHEIEQRTMREEYLREQFEELKKRGEGTKAENEKWERNLKADLEKLKLQGELAQKQKDDHERKIREDLAEIKSQTDLQVKMKELEAQRVHKELAEVTHLNRRLSDKNDRGSVKKTALRVFNSAFDKVERVAEKVVEKVERL